MTRKDIRLSATSPHFDAEQVEQQRDGDVANRQRKCKAGTAAPIAACRTETARRRCRSPVSTGPPWCKLGNDWPANAGCRLWASPAAAWRTAVAGRSSTARSWTCWRSSDRSRVRRYTRWTESCGSLPDRIRDLTMPDHRLPLRLTCAVT